MRLSNFAAAVALGVSAIAVSAGCATGFPAKVSRYQAMPAPQGQSFFVVPGPGNPGGLEFSRYANLVSQAMAAQGYAPATSPAAATMVVEMNYGVDAGTPVYESDPLYGPGAYGPFGYYGRPYYSRWGYWGPRSPFYYGWDSPFGGGLNRYTEYKSQLDLRIVRASDRASLFEGHARARSQTDNLGVLVPNLVEAMFTGFPGRSGEMVKITVPPERRVR